MTTFVYELIRHSAQSTPHAIALQVKNCQLSYQALNKAVQQVANSYSALSIKQGDRIGIYLAKTIENVTSTFASSIIGAAFVPLNPVLKAPQIEHILNDCQITCLITNKSRLKALIPILHKVPHLTQLVITDATCEEVRVIQLNITLPIISWADFLSLKDRGISSTIKQHSNDLAAILYTSGSTGKPKGIMLSHKNIVLGAKSVAQYLQSNNKDKVLAVLPLSFDYGLNQLTSSFFVGAQCILLDYLFANDVIKAIEEHQITGLAAVPPLWAQLIKAKWPENKAKSLRYFTNSGGVLAPSILEKLRDVMPKAKPYLMYGLTEAFRSTYLDPDEIDNKIGSIGKAIPNSQILVINANGRECRAGEVGELVHTGPLVSLGYWQNAQASMERFKSPPLQACNTDKAELAVYSGDFVKRDSEGFLYFISRQDEMIKTSGYRISPAEVEEIILTYDKVLQTCVIGIEHKELGQGILAFVTLNNKNDNIIEFEKSLSKHCQSKLANYMIPKHIITLTDLPYNANGKIDKQFLKENYHDLFTKA
jgi:acyl-CoA ligase (AMP-forming) (exosortase A-associated)